MDSTGWLILERVGGVKFSRLRDLHDSSESLVSSNSLMVCKGSIT